LKSSDSIRINFQANNHNEFVTVTFSNSKLIYNRYIIIIYALYVKKKQFVITNVDASEPQILPEVVYYHNSIIGRAGRRPHAPGNSQLSHLYEITFVCCHFVIYSVKLYKCHTAGDTVSL